MKKRDGRRAALFYYNSFLQNMLGRGHRAKPYSALSVFGERRTHAPGLSGQLEGSLLPDAQEFHYVPGMSWVIQLPVQDTAAAKKALRLPQGGIVHRVYDQHDMYIRVFLHDLRRDDGSVGNRGPYVYYKHRKRGLYDQSNIQQHVVVLEYYDGVFYND